MEQHGCLTIQKCKMYLCNVFFHDIIKEVELEFLCIKVVHRKKSNSLRNGRNVQSIARRAQELKVNNMTEVVGCL